MDNDAIWATVRVAGGMLSYMPHSGHTDQLRQLSLARAVAEALHRTLVVPHMLGHFDATAKTSEVSLARKISRLHRPPMSYLLNLSYLGGAPLIESAALPWPHELPRCSNESIVHIASTRDIEKLRCVHVIEPPSAHESASAKLRAWAQLKHVPWLHLRSMLWAHGPRRESRMANPLTTWEEQLAPTDCKIQYSPQRASGR